MRQWFLSNATIFKINFKDKIETDGTLFQEIQIFRMELPHMIKKEYRLKAVLRFRI